MEKEKTMKDLEMFHGIIHNLIGLKCEYLGACTVGATVRLKFGKLVYSPIKMERIPPESDVNMRGEANVLIWCPWRMDSKNKPIVSSDCCEDRIKKDLKRLVGKKVVDIFVDEPAHDLTICFTNNLKIKVFCEFLPGSPTFDRNYYFEYKNTFFSVGPGCCVIATDSLRPYSTILDNVVADVRDDSCNSTETNTNKVKRKKTKSTHAIKTTLK